MIKQPKHPVGPDFDKARDWMNQQERQLTESQRGDYDKLKQNQEKQRNEQQQKLDSYRRELEQKAKQRKAITELVYHPPIKSADPNTKLIVQKAMEAEKNLSKLKHDHKNERITALETFEQQRTQDKQKASTQDKQKASKGFEDSWKRAVEKAAHQENDRDRVHDLSKDFDKSR